MTNGVRRVLLQLLGAAALFAVGWFLGGLMIVFVLTVSGLVFTHDLSQFDGVLIAVQLLTGGALAIAYVLYARRQQKKALGDSAREKRFTRILVLVPVICFVALGASFASIALRDARNARWSAEHEARAQSLDDLLQARFQPTNLAVVPQVGGTWQATADLAGKWPGQYRVAWDVVDGNFDKVLASGTQDMALDGSQSFSASFGQSDLEGGYRSKVLNGSGSGVLVDEHFTFRLHVTPLLSDSEMAGLPGVVRTTSARDQLTASAQASFPVHFVIPS